MTLTDKILTPLTEGWLELFLTPVEKERFSKWDEKVSNKSISNKLSANYFDQFTSYIPENISPNMITLVGLSCLCHGWYITNLYGQAYPVPCTWFTIINIAIYFITNGIDSRHAIRIRQKTVLNELFKYSVDCIAMVFLSILAAYCLGAERWQTLWYAVQTSQLILFSKHLSAFHRKAGIRYNVLTGPGELITVITLLLFLRATLGLDWMIMLYENTLRKVVLVLADYDLFLPDKANAAWSMGAELMKISYYTMYIICVSKSLMLSAEHSWSRFGISLCLLIRLGPAVVIAIGMPYECSAVDVICDGLFMSILITDVTLAKMAGREIHPWVVLMSFCMMLSHSVLLSLVAVYYVAVFADLSHYLNLPLLTVCKNVYCDGVYDLCHIGHKNLFKRALTYGNRLFVGVCGDADCSTYKRPPIMTHDERCAEVAACKAVTKVIENAPCFGITQDFIDKHQIHVVAFGQEYLEKWPNPNDDIYYGYCRKIGIAKPMPRTPGLSTSDLIKRIQQSEPADQKKSQT